MRPLFDALYDMMDPDRLSAYMERGTVEVAPLAFMRGRTLNDSFIILDEAQNTSPEQMQMFLTRLGFGSKVVVTGDVTQVDLPARPGVRPDPGARHPQLDRRDRLRRVLAPGRRPAQARAADRRGVQAPRRRDRHRPQAVTVVAVEVENRSGAEVDEAAAVELAQRVLAAEGDRRGRARARVRRPRGEPRAEAGAPRHRRGDGRALVPARRARRAAGRACRARSATSSSARRSSATRGGSRSCTASCTCSATSTARRWRSGRGRCCEVPAPALDHRVVQLRLRGDHPRAPHAAEHADPLRRRRARADRGARVRASTSWS